MLSNKKLGRHFFAKNTLLVAKELLGKFLVRKIGQEKISAMITETEAYCGPDDLASHASRGKTARTAIMFGPPGYAYVYMIYGMYFCLNVVTEKENYPAAVLIRSVKIAQSEKRKAQNNNSKLKAEEINLSGPGKLCRELKIDKKLNGEDIVQSKKLWLEDRGVKIRTSQVLKLKRVGVDYALEYKDKPWRFVLKLNK